MKIISTPNSILTTPSAPVVKISAKGGPALGWDKPVLEFIEEMKKTLLQTSNPKGVGLAAPQIGKNLQIFVTKPFDKSKLSVFINPKILSHSNDLTEGVPERERKLEGCLSIPRVWGMVRRYKTIKLSYQTPDGKSHTKEFKGFMATIIQHEMDHLDGRLFPSRTLEQKGKLYQAVQNQKKEEELEEIRIS